MAGKENWLQKAGEAVLKGIEWFASPKGQEVVASAEGVAEIVYPPSQPIIAIVNAWLGKTAAVEGKAMAAASLGTNVTSAQKAEAAIGAVTPDIEAILRQYKLAPLTAEQYKAINDAVVTIENSLTPVA